MLLSILNDYYQEGDWSFASVDEVVDDINENGIAIYYDKEKYEEGKPFDGYIAIYAPELHNLIASISYQMVPNNCIGKALVKLEKMLSPDNEKTMFLKDKDTMNRKYSSRSGEYIFFITNIEIVEKFNIPEIRKRLFSFSFLARAIDVSCGNLLRKACGLYVELNDNTTPKHYLKEMSGFTSITNSLYFKTIKKEVFKDSQIIEKKL